MVTIFSQSGPILIEYQVMSLSLSIVGKSTWKVAMFVEKVERKQITEQKINDRNNEINMAHST